MAILHDDNLQERANDLAAAGFNGLRMVLVTLQPAAAPSEARLEVFFQNTNAVPAILADAQASAVAARAVFPITGGFRMKAGDAIGQDKVTGVAAGSASSLVLIVAPIGDYSTYRLGIVHAQIDPLFSELPFKFRPGCFNNDCAPAWEPAPAPRPAPMIDYLAKDYDSFRHTLIAAMMQRVPDWQSTSEADLDQVLIDLFSAAADELSDFQDRVMNEAYLASARKRVSLARHARLMDYHIHQGSQASTWLALITEPGVVLDFPLPAGFLVWTGRQELLPNTVFFATREPALIHPLLSRMRLHTWSDAIPALAAGSTTADLVLETPGGPAANEVRDLIRAGSVRQLVVQEHLNPATGTAIGHRPERRQLLRLLPGDAGAESVHDPVNDTWVVRVRWEERDALKSNFCFVVFCPGRVPDVSLFHGNVVAVHEGLAVKALFRDADEPLNADEHYFERTARWGALCPLPYAPLAYLDTPPGGEAPPASTLRVTVESPSDPKDTWDEVISLVHSDDSAEEGDHFAVETDELGRSVLRFGNGTNGRVLPPRTIVHCEYQVGGGVRGNVGRDTLRFLEQPNIAECWNPFDVTNGRDPEPVEKIVRAAPEAFRTRQLRAVTLADYIRRAEEVPGVSRAVASYAWTGSWRTVRICIDPQGATELDEPLRTAVVRHIEAVRLIGEDIELRPPRFVPLEIDVALCVHPDFWSEDVRFLLEQEFSAGYTPDGRLAFFHPNHWTFGQSLRRSEITGRVHGLQGIEHVIAIAMKRFNEPTPGAAAEVIEVRFNEIIQVFNDPDHLEKGSIRFELKGGRQ